ncbi:MAG TPA: alpha/beta hydrolase [Nocardioidaceae bacterium]|nr:alpha/beta hydrolase [Nocardioidaceae bacterium]
MTARRVAIASALAMLATMAPSVSTPATAAPEPKTTDGCISSVPEPGTSEAVKICYTLFKPAGASRAHKVPMVLHSHGWGGSRTTDVDSFEKWLNAGFGILSFDQRGFGESGGKAHVENPAYEGKDVQRLVRLVSKLRWVKKDGKGDPRLGAIGGSYGGGYQFVGAFRQLMDRGEPIFDALAPEITWYDLKESLAPQEVGRSAWITALTAAGAEALPPEVVAASLQGVATGMWPDGTVPGTADMNAFFKKNGPAWHVAQGRRLDIPVLFGQGATDTLFPLDQGLKNFQRALTPKARRHSIFVGYNGGHVLPAVFPQAVGVAGDPCSKKLAGGSFTDLAIRFFTEKLKRKDTGLNGYGRYHLATAGAGCTTVGSVVADKSFPVGTVATSETVGAPIAVKIADGPIRVAGTPYLDGTMFAAGVNNRAFYGLAVGTSPADARLVQNNVLPVNELAPVLGEERSIELPSVAVDVAKGESLFVLATPISDTFAGMGSRTPGAIILQDAVVRLPVVGR